MNDEDFDKLCKSLELAIAHASGEEVAGVVIHNVAKPSEPEKVTSRRTAMPFRVENSNDAVLAH